MITSAGNAGAHTSNLIYNLHVNGQAGGTSGWINFSDGRLKTQVQPITNRLDIVEHLRGVPFQW